MPVEKEVARITFDSGGHCFAVVVVVVGRGAFPAAIVEGAGGGARPKTTTRGGGGGGGAGGPRVSLSPSLAGRRQGGRRRAGQTPPLDARVRCHRLPSYYCCCCSRTKTQELEKTTLPLVSEGTPSRSRGASRRWAESRSGDEMRTTPPPPPTVEEVEVVGGGPPSPRDNDKEVSSTTKFVVVVVVLGV